MPNNGNGHESRRKSVTASQRRSRRGVNTASNNILEPDKGPKDEFVAPRPRTAIRPVDPKERLARKDPFRHKSYTKAKPQSQNLASRPEASGKEKFWVTAKKCLDGPSMRLELAKNETMNRQVYEDPSFFRMGLLPAQDHQGKIRFPDKRLHPPDKADALRPESLSKQLQLKCPARPLTSPWDSTTRMVTGGIWRKREPIA